MASKFVVILCVLAVATRAMAGVATYAHSPYAAYHVPAAAATVYHSQPLAYHATSPYFARSLVASAPAAVQTYASPIVRSYAAAPVAAVSPLVRTYAAAPVATYSAAPVTAVKSVVPAPVVAAPVVTKAAVVAPTILKSVELESSPRYDFSYGVHDSVTGDIKNQVESRNGGNVAGSYSVVDADGYKRTVTYTADDFNGFNAVVQREPLVGVAAPVVSAPVQHVSVQQDIQYLPAQQQISTIQQQLQQEYLPQIPSVPAQHEPASEPVPVEYPQQQQPAQEQYPQDHQYPPFSQFENPQQQGSNNLDSDDDSEVVELRSASDNAESASSATPAPVVENQKDSIPPKSTA